MKDIKTNFCNCETCRKMKAKYMSNKFKHGGIIPKNDEVKKHLKPFAQPGTTVRKVQPESVTTLPSILNNKHLEHYIELGNGKYTIYQERYKGVKALRYDQPWRDCTGDYLISNLMVDLSDAKNRIQKALNYLNKPSASVDEEMDEYKHTIIAILEDTL